MSSRGRLANRLGKLKDLGLLPASSVPPPRPRVKEEGSRSPLPGWRQAGEFVFTRVLSTELALPEKMPQGSVLVEPGTETSRLVFLDTETTGLSGGTGTVIFLVGLGTVRRNTFAVEQFFLADYPGELEYLELVLSRLRPDCVFVSYNGRSFDVPLLRTRLAMNGLSYDFESQVDLLHPVRRLWKSLIGACNLSHVEEALLGVRREKDVPGSEVPGIYFDYLRGGGLAMLDLVFEHHLQDVRTLASLLIHIERVLAEPAHAYADPFQLGRWLVVLGRPEGRGLLEEAADQGDARAVRLLSRMLKRGGEWGQASEWWQGLWARKRDGWAAVELMKYYEHKLRDYAAALFILEEVEIEKRNVFRRPSGGREKRVGIPESAAQLALRRRRLERKAASYASS